MYTFSLYIYKKYIYLYSPHVPMFTISYPPKFITVNTYLKEEEKKHKWLIKAHKTLNYNQEKEENNLQLPSKQNHLIN